MPVRFDHGPSSWPSWILVVAAALGGLVAVLLGTVGWLGLGFGIGTSCVDGGHEAVQCAAAHHWIIAGGLGQWALVVAACVLVVQGLTRSWSSLRALMCFAVLPLSVAWITITTLLAESSF